MTPSLALHSRDVRLCDADTLAETSESSSGAESAQSATERKPPLGAADFRYDRIVSS